MNERQPDEQAPQTQEPLEPDEFEKSEESLEELRERTAETMAEARQEVDRAMETSHDQLMPSTQADGSDEYVDEEGVPEDVEDTRGAWPNWTKRK